MSIQRIFYLYQCVIPSHSRSNKVINYVFSSFLFEPAIINLPDVHEDFKQNREKALPIALNYDHHATNVQQDITNQINRFYFNDEVFSPNTYQNLTNVIFSVLMLLPFYMFMFFVFFFVSIWVYNFMFYVPLAFYGWLVLGRNGRIFKTTTVEGKTRQSWTHLHVLFLSYRFS